MGEAARKLMALQGHREAYETPYEAVRDVQIAALNERLQEQVGRIKLLGLRARDAGISQITSLEDVVPLLMPHTAYKSYPESVIADGRWDRLTKWLGTVTAYPVDNVDLDGVADIDGWIARLELAGHHVSCTSGTTGKPAMLVGTAEDMAWRGRDSVAACCWSTGLKPDRDRRIHAVAAMARMPSVRAISAALTDAFQIPGTAQFDYPVPEITIGSIMNMITLRKAISEGTARPGDLERFEETSAIRAKAMADAVVLAADALIAARKDKLFISGMWAALHPVAVEVRNRGYSAGDFNPDNNCYIAGGLKGAVLPDDYKEFVFETFNLRPERNFQIYGMQEIGTVMPRCKEGGRYHVPPWLVCLPLNKDGDALAGPCKGEIEARAAFFDLSMDGRWGGLISGDRIQIDFSPCACGAGTPSVADTIVRYQDLEGDDKISCSGTVDAYVKGMS